MVGKPSRAVWLIATGLGWAFLFPAVTWLVVEPVAGLMFEETVGSHPRLEALWSPLMHNPMMSEIPFEVAVMALVTGMGIWALVRFAKAPSPLWLGVCLGVAVSWTLSALWALEVTALFGALLARGNWDTLVYSGVPLGLSSIAGAWLGERIALYQILHPSPEREDRTDVFEEDDVSEVPVTREVPLPSNEPFDLGDE